jgi:prepilin-type N-terminal cleavage/methylation domain-containing protein
MLIALLKTTIIFIQHKKTVNNDHQHTQLKEELMLQKLRANNTQGFTLIELMIVIAIIGILAAIAIPNFISYRNKGYCSAAESDANNLAAAVADYFSDPENVSVSGTDMVDGDTFGDSNIGVTLSYGNQADVSTTDDVVEIIIDETAGKDKCPEGDNFVKYVGGTNSTGYWKE